LFEIWILTLDMRKMRDKDSETLIAISCSRWPPNEPEPTVLSLTIRSAPIAKARTTKSLSATK